MSLSRQTHIFVHFPSTGEVFEETVNYKETILQFTTRMLKSLNINNPDAFHLYAINQKCMHFKPDDSCSLLFGIYCKQIILTRFELVNIDLFFENRHYYIVYEKSTPSMNFLENSLKVLQSSTSTFKPPLTKDDLINYCFALYDPIADVIIHSNSPINTTFLILKRFEYISPGFVFDFSIIKDITPKLSNCSYENAVISNFVKQFRSCHRNEHISGIEFVEFSEKRSQFLFDSFRNKQFNKNDVSISEQVNFLFAVLSMAKQPYIPSSLQEMILEAMKFDDDRKIFDYAKAIALYMPLSTYLVLQEIFQFFGVATIDETSWNNVSLMLAELLFETKSEYKETLNPYDEKYKFETSTKKEERKNETFIQFTRFLFLYFKQIFNLKDSIGRKNKIRMIKKDSIYNPKNRIKKSKNKKENRSTNQNLNYNEFGDSFDWVDEEFNSNQSNQNNNEFGDSFDWVDEEPLSSQNSKKKEESEFIYNENDNSNSNDKISKTGRKIKDKKNQNETENAEIVNSNETDSKNENKNGDEESLDQTETENYTFILYEEMKSKEMITRTIDGIIDINIDDTIEFIPSGSIFNLLNSLASNEDEDTKDISNELVKLNTTISSIKSKFNSSGLLNQLLSQGSKF